MALTKISTDGVKDDAITKAKIPADQIEASELANDAVDTNAIQDDAVTEDKLANSINTAIAANTAKDLTALSASNLTSGTVPDARFPATLPAISGANLTNLPASGKATNLAINGAMQVAQRSTSKNTTGASSTYGTLDRFMVQIQSGTLTESQENLSSSDTPYTLGFRKYMRILNQSGIGAGAAQYAEIDQRIEAQNIAQSGWNYTSSSSYITLSFWVRASVSQAYVAVLYSNDGTQRHYPFEIKDSGGSTLSANTWTKITKTIPGDSGITINNDNGNGATLSFIAAYGTNYTSSSGNFDAWNTTGGGNDRWPDMTTTWATTTNATFDITGVQLEVGDAATDFAFESYSETLRKCQRYFFPFLDLPQGTTGEIDIGCYFTATHISFFFRYPVVMRAVPTPSAYVDNYAYYIATNGGTQYFGGGVGNGSAITFEIGSTEQYSAYSTGMSGGVAGRAGLIRAVKSGSFVHFSAEL